MTESLADFVAHRLDALGDSERATQMAAYMKTEMPFYGVASPQRKAISREVSRLFQPADQETYRANVVDLWTRPSREEKYLAISYARAFPAFITVSQVDLYRRMVVEGAWWDFVDEIATHLIGDVVQQHRSEMRPLLEGWIDGPDLWLRRTAIICQLRHKTDTDVEMLFDFCRRCADEKDFFIRKAIGWALREHAKTDAEAVRRFLAEMGEGLSPLSRREASKHL